MMGCVSYTTLTWERLRRLFYEKFSVPSIGIKHLQLNNIYR